MNVLDFLGRLFIAVIFFMAGVNKVSGYESTQAYMTKFGVPGELLPLVIALEIVGPILLVVGWQTRLAALGLAIFSLLAAFLFHNDFANQMQAIMFMKNLAISGGLLILAAHGPGNWSMDRRRR